MSTVERKIGALKGKLTVTTTKGGETTTREIDVKQSGGGTASTTRKTKTQPKPAPPKATTPVAPPPATSTKEETRQGIYQGSMGIKLTTKKPTQPLNIPFQDRKETQPQIGTGESAKVTVGSILELNKDYVTRKKENEELADYTTTIGIKELTGPDKDENINKVKARFAHMAMASAEGFVKTLPLAALGTVGGAGGAVVVTLMGAATAASMLNPANRKALDQFVTEHPQEFMATLSGALLAGVSVSEVRSAFKAHTKNMKLKERRAFEKKWDEIIDDVNFKEQIKGSEFPSNIDKKLQAIEKANARKAAEKIINDPAYFEQQLGAEFPSRAIEVPTPTGDKIWVSNPINADDEIMYNFVMGLSKDNPGDVVNKFWKDAKANNMAMWYDATGEGVFDSITVPDLVNKYPGLKEPYINPALLDPTVVNRAGIVSKNPSTWFNPATLDPSLFNKADIVARVGTSQPSMMTVALAVYSSQGYITKEQLDALIKANQVHINALKELGVQIPSDYTDASLREKSLSDFVQDVEEIAETIQDTPDPIPPPDPTPTPPPKQRKTPPPPEPPKTVEETPPPETQRLLGLSRSDVEKRRAMNLSLHSGKKMLYRVNYPDLKQVIGPLEARSLPDALGKAQRQRRTAKKLPRTIIVDLIGERKT